jgi:asparagine synthase (glutamine-hydrolysing)
MGFLAGRAVRPLSWFAGMCGVIAMVSQRHAVDRGALERGIHAMHHRGPDQRHTWISDGGRAGLGHARLSIIDLDSGTQPIANEDGSLQIAVNGEFYDFERIRNQLEREGHRFRTRSDSEIALHLYEQHGLGFLDHLRGEFAFVLWDERNRMLLAARDRFGIKPLLYTVHDGTLIVASEAKAIRAAGVPLRWDEGSFFHCMQLQYMHFDRTLFEGIYQVRPGHYLLATDGHVQSHRYWDHDYPRADERAAADPEELTAMFRAQLDEAVRLRLRADVPVACFLSGGLDSASVAGIATQQLGRPLPCFTICFDDDAYDEFPIAEETARTLGAEFHPLRATRRDLLAALPEAIFHAEGLVVNGHLAAKFLLSRHVRDAGFKVVLSGEGSDEILLGYPHFRADLWSQNPARLEQLRQTNEVSAGLLLPQGDTLPLGQLERALGFAPSFLQTKASLGRRNLDLLSADFVSRFAGRDPFAVLLLGIDHAGQLAGRHRLDQSAYLWLKIAFPNYLLRLLGDASEMAHSVEGRVPFLDHHLARFAHSLPIDVKIRGDTEKAILRDAARPVLTDRVHARQKQALFTPPLSGSANRDADALFQDFLRARAGRGAVLRPAQGRPGPGSAAAHERARAHRHRSVSDDGAQRVRSPGALPTVRAAPP